MICYLIRCLRESIYFYICHIYDDMKLDEYNDNYDDNDNNDYKSIPLIDYNDYKSIPLISSNENEVLEEKSEKEKWKNEGIELKPYCNDKYSDGNIVIVLDKSNTTHNSHNSHNTNNTTNNISNLRSRKDNELDWIVL